MEQDKFRRAMWGLDPKDVGNQVASLIAERDAEREKALVAEAAYTELRLQSARQVEEASAEAAVVLGHSRNEATRVREAAVTEADRMRRGGETTAQRLVDEAEAEITSRLADVKEKEEEATRTVSASQASADEIIRFANLQADKLRSEAYEILRSAEARSQSADNEIRLQRLDAQRAEGELIDKADQYSRRVHEEADRHWQTTQRRSEELRVQAEDLLRETQTRAQEISTDAVDTARRLMEETMDQLTRIGSEVGGSMSVISRVRRSLGDQLDRLELADERGRARVAGNPEPLQVSLSRQGDAAAPDQLGSSEEPAEPGDDDELDPAESSHDDSEVGTTESPDEGQESRQ